LQSDSQATEILSPATVASEHPWRGYLFIAIATLCWGAAATFGKAIFNGSLFSGHSMISPLVLSQTRTTFAGVLLSLFLLARDGLQAFKISSRDLLLCVLIGTLGVAGSNYFYYLAIQKTTVAIAITVQYTAPVWVLLYMVVRHRQKATPRRLMAVLLALVGIALTIRLFHSDTSLNWWGVGAATLAAFSFSFYNVAGQGLVTRNHPLTVMSYALLGAALMWIILDPPWRLAALRFSGMQWSFLFLFACFSMLLPYIFYFTGLKYLDPTRAVITSCLEPVFATLFAVIFVHEAVRGLQVVGIAAVLAATVMVVRPEEKSYR
jgi:drug/metabolite transporter (DMT)-like permease